MGNPLLLPSGVYLFKVRDSYLVQLQHGFLQNLNWTVSDFCLSTGKWGFSSVPRGTDSHVEAHWDTFAPSNSPLVSWRPGTGSEEEHIVVMEKWWSKWRFQIFFYFHPEVSGRFPFWLLFFRWVETTSICKNGYSSWFWFLEVDGHIRNSPDSILRVTLFKGFCWKHPTATRIATGVSVVDHGKIPSHPCRLSLKSGWFWWCAMPLFLGSCV